MSHDCILTAGVSRDRLPVLNGMLFLVDGVICFFLFFCAPPVGQSTKRTEGKGLVLRATSFGALNTFPSAVFVLTFILILSSPLAWAVVLYLRHSGIKLRDSKVFPGLSTEKEKWLAFLKTKKVWPVSVFYLYKP